MVKIVDNNSPDLTAEDVINLVGEHALKKRIAQVPLSDKISIAAKLGVPTDTSAQQLNTLIFAHMANRYTHDGTSSDHHAEPHSEMLYSGDTTKVEDTSQLALAVAEKEIAALKASLQAATEQKEEHKRNLDTCKDELAKCKADCEEFKAEAIQLRQRQKLHSAPRAVEPEAQELADKVSELEQENIVLGALYRNACRRLEKYEQSASEKITSNLQQEGGLADSGETPSAEQVGLVESALPLEECRKLCPTQSVQRRTEEWVLKHSWGGGRGFAEEGEEEEEGGQDKCAHNSSSASSDHGFLSGSIPEGEEEEDDDSSSRKREELLAGGGGCDAARDGARGDSAQVPIGRYGGNPVNRVARAAWKKATPAGGLRAQSATVNNPTGGYTGILGSLLGGVGKTVKRKEADIVVFDP
mmetsp:Transcript_18378/g.37283  ORF Transcript_18378/g.37283 Transcript_18378/m.37283 type:complete len:414 (+) Transcript_18378:109-1350(+)|eukprot:CAMPEP_0181311442 /NCGR_PEP_ID=MMETSP1101-20121128/13138_1 /TAXON_ID=46948 /ORGANISM="Rhodomonas abbreviata, Strain Caron Lab Isolate" /LENGTH=413 /DNA_ID=CAMNT_0023418171 /DNA_START=105 /DNA_END=1346 /DNA_ORIENTATION=-